ncbi:MAG: diguanylate cyclase [Waddliaceae bacterium]|nr:diguanylate cyclase [Waddliaceae bacterium]
MSSSFDPALFEAAPSTINAEALTRPSLSYWQASCLRFKKNKAAFFGLVLLSLLLFMAIVGPSLNSYTYYENHLELKNHPPSINYWFGSDDLGRDLFTRVWYGARISLFVGISAALIDLIIGVLWGSIAAFSGGRIDEIMMRIADILYGLPYLLIVVLLMVVLGSGIIPIIIALTVTGWVNMARIVRGQILLLKKQEYVQAAILLGASFPRILFRHLIPNAMSPILVTVTLTIPSAIFSEAFLSFLGLGIQAPIASWGTMASDGLPALAYYPWRLFFPAFFISLTMLAFNLIGDGMRDALDPKQR